MVDALVKHVLLDMHVVVQRQVLMVQTLQKTVEVPQLQVPVDVGVKCSDKFPAVPGAASDLFIDNMFKF